MCADGDVISLHRRSTMVATATRRASGMSRSRSSPQAARLPSDVVAVMGMVDPSPVVRHRIVHPVTAASGEGVGEERDGVDGDGRPVLVAGAFGEAVCHRCEPGDVVDAVSGRSIGYRADGVLHDADVVDECRQVGGAHRCQLRLAALRTRRCRCEPGRVARAAPRWPARRRATTATPRRRGRR